MAEPTSKQASRRQGGRQPISRHPLFPVIVGLWFAALLALGSFALSTSLLEALVLAGHIDAFVPAAAPPLGITARLLLAFGLGAVGAAIGWTLARRMGDPTVVPTPQVFKVADADFAAPQWPGTAEAPPHAVFAIPETVAEAPAPVLDPASLFGDAEGELPEPAMIEHAAIEAEPPAPPTPTAAQRIASADLRELSHVELVERLAIALQRREERLGTTPVEATGIDPEIDNAVVHFPEFTDRRNARLPLATAQSRPAPQETEKALREALAQLQRISGGA